MALAQLNNMHGNKISSTGSGFAIIICIYIMYLGAGGWLSMLAGVSSQRAPSRAAVRGAGCAGGCLRTSDARHLFGL